MEKNRDEYDSEIGIFVNTNRKSGNDLHGEASTTKERYNNARKLLLIIKVIGAVSAVAFFAIGLISFVATISNEGGTLSLSIGSFLISGLMLFLSLAQAEFGEAFLDMVENSHRNNDMMIKLLERDP